MCAFLCCVFLCRCLVNSGNAYNTVFEGQVCWMWSLFATLLAYGMCRQSILRYAVRCPPGYRKLFPSQLCCQDDPHGRPGYSWDRPNVCQAGRDVCAPHPHSAGMLHRAFSLVDGGQFTDTSVSQCEY